MENQQPDRRRAARYPTEARVTVHPSGGASVAATAANISAAGMLLRVEEPSGLRLGDQVTVEVELPEGPGTPFSAWGVGTIVRIEGRHHAIHLQAGAFDTELGPPRDCSSMPGGSPENRPPRHIANGRSRR